MTVSAGLVNANNLTVTGVGSGAVTATNVTATNLTATTVNATNVGLSNLSVTGDLTVDGKFVASLKDLVEYQNLCWRQQFNVAEIYTQQDLGDVYTVNSQYYVWNNSAILELTLQDDSGNPTSILTESSPWSNPRELDVYENPAPLIKINGVDASGVPLSGASGEFTYIDVGATSITDICKALLPENLKTYKTYYNNSATGNSLTENSRTDVCSVLWDIKRGFPQPDTNGIKDYNNHHIFYNNMVAINYPNYGPFVNTMAIGLDINPWIDGSGSMDFYLLGGINKTVALGIPTIDWAAQGITVVPPFPVQVTTDAVEYMQKKTNGENSVYLNTKLNIINFNILDFNDYNTKFPFGNYDTSNSVLDSSNAIIVRPQTFTGAFGFFRNLVESTNNGTDSLPNLPVDPNISYTEYNYRNPVQSSLAASEFMVQVSDTLDFTYTMSNKEDLQTVSVETFATTGGNDFYNPVPHDICTAIILPRYEFGLHTNSVTQLVSPEADEHTGTPFTRGEKIGYNRNPPYLPDLVNGISGMTTESDIGTFFAVYVTDTTKGPDNQELLDPNNATQDNPSVRTLILPHEMAHIKMFSIGISDYINYFFDDEWMANIYDACFSHNGFYNDSSGNSEYIMAAIQRETYYMSRGTLLPFAYVHTDSFLPMAKGTNSYLVSTFWSYSTSYQFGYPLGVFSGRIVDSYDPNGQHVKLIL
jgi:hypothetical protein